MQREQPQFGAIPDAEGVRFRVMAPRARDVRLVLHDGGAAGTHALQRCSDGTFAAGIRGAAAGDRYRFQVDGADALPDPASRFQPEGVHGPSQVIDPSVYRWSDDRWRGLPARDLVIYELHVGTFTEAGTFTGARQRLRDLRDTGVTAIELMPVADFGGSRNWGYDGAALFAPARAYGSPDDFRALVDAAHQLGLAVLLDVVYNHLGPEGAYLAHFNPEYITDRYSTPWGGAVNLDGTGSALVRRFIVDNAVHWIREYHLDGLRLDATHALVDTSPRHIVAELADAARGAARWPIAIHAEDHRNLAALLDPVDAGGWGLDGLWADDFHHVVRRLLAGDTHGYYEDFGGTTEELTRTITQGWLFTGQHSIHMNCPRGTDASSVPMRQCIVCLQNHDQVGNRAFGDRLHHAIDAPSWRAASALLLTCPMTPLLFMGQEWAASSPFQFFTDFEPGLGKAVTEGRRREFKAFPAFADDPSAADRVPDPQAVSTFEASKLRWDERSRPPHARTLALYKALLGLRASHPALGASDRCSTDAWARGDDAVLMRRTEANESFLVVARLRGRGPVQIGSLPLEGGGHGELGASPRRAGGSHEPVVVLTTEDARFVDDPQPPQVSRSVVTFERPGAVVLQLS
jgi:maltooligosyltrehalose trehalohydrolase